MSHTIAQGRFIDHIFNSKRRYEASWSPVELPKQLYSRMSHAATRLPVGSVQELHSFLVRDGLNRWENDPVGLKAAMKGTQ